MGDIDPFTRVYAHEIERTGLPEAMQGFRDGYRTGFAHVLRTGELPRLEQPNAEDSDSD